MTACLQRMRPTHTPIPPFAWLRAHDPFETGPHAERAGGIAAELYHDWALRHGRNRSAGPRHSPASSPEVGRTRLRRFRRGREACRGRYSSGCAHHGHCRCVRRSWFLLVVTNSLGPLGMLWTRYARRRAGILIRLWRKARPGWKNGCTASMRLFRIRNSFFSALPVTEK